MTEVLELKDTFCGMHISTACLNAVKLADKENKPVHFKFNDTNVIVQPNETVETVEARWDVTREAEYQAYISSPEYAEKQARWAAEAKTEREAIMVEKAQTEEEMREAKVPWPKTQKQLIEYIDSLVNRSQDYGTCVYAMSMAAEATFNYMSGIVGSTGFQASCADLDFVRRTRLIKGPFILLTGENALYPQSDPREKLETVLEEWKPWLKEQAEKNLQDRSLAHPDVVEHWKKLAK